MARRTDSTDIDEQERRAIIRNIATHHRAHERHHSLRPFEHAAEIRKYSNALKGLADRWLAVQQPPADAQKYQNPMYRVAGCTDLNDLAVVSTLGVLFMEGEGAPREIHEMKLRVRQIADEHAYMDKWLVDKMEAAWKREAGALRPETAAAAYHRITALLGTTLSGETLGLVARLLDASLKALDEIEFEPAKLRQDLTGSARLLRTTTWLMDKAAALLISESIDLGLSDPHWTLFLQATEPEASDAEASE